MAPDTAGDNSGSKAPDAKKFVPESIEPDRQDSDREDPDIASMHLAADTDDSESAIEPEITLEESQEAASANSPEISLHGREETQSQELSSEVPSDIPSEFHESGEEIDRFADLPKLEGNELTVARTLQGELKNYLPVLNPARPGQSQVEHSEALERQKAEIELEREAGVFGPATRKAYGDFVKWYEQGAVPGTIRLMSTMGMELPPGCPWEMPTNNNGRSIRPDLFRNLVSTGELKFDSGLSGDKLPTNDELDSMLEGIYWIEKCDQSYKQVVQNRQIEQVSDLIKKESLPEGWLEGRDRNPGTWLESAYENIDLATRTRNYIEAMHSLHKASSHRDFPFELPPNTEITIEINGKAHQIKASEAGEPANRSLLSNRNGTITGVKLDLPQDLKQDDPVNSAKMERMRQWLDKHGERIEQTLVNDMDFRRNPDRVLMYGDQELHDSPEVQFQGRFNDRGELLGIVNAKEYKLQPGENLRDMNLVGYDFSARKTDDGRILVEQDIQGWDMPWWGYQNIRAFGDKVGQKMAFTELMPEGFHENHEKFEIKIEGETRTLWRSKTDPKGPVFEVLGDGAEARVKEMKLYGADEFVPVRNGSRMEIIKAGNLDSFRTNQQLFYYGEKSLMVALDASMVVSGSITVGAAFKGARVAAATGVRLTAGQAALEAGKGLTRVTVGGLGLLNNAGAREHEWGRTVNTARGIYFLADISHGLLKGGFGLARGAGAAESMSGAQKVHSVIYGTEGARAIEGAQALKGMGWIASTHKATDLTFKVTELGFVPIIGSELKHQIRDIAEIGSRDPLIDAHIQIGDGRGLQKAEKGSFDPANKEALEGTEKLIDGYRSILTDGRSPETSAQVKEILDKLKHVMGPDATEQEKEAFRIEMLENLTFKPEELIALEKLRSASISVSNDKKPTDEAFYSQFQLSNEDIHKLLDPDKAADVKPGALRKLAAEILAGRDPDVKAASMMALIFASRDSEGSIASQLAEVKLEIPEYTRTVYEIHPASHSEGVSESKPREITVAARSAVDTLGAREAVDRLMRDLESPNLGNRGIATGDLLVRTGAITHRQYASILQNILENPAASAQDKMRALTDPSGARFATIIDGVRYEEDMRAKSEGSAEQIERLREQGKSFGLSSKELLSTLRDTASNTAENADVRAMAALLLLGLEEPNIHRRSNILEAANAAWQVKEGRLDGSFSREVKDFLHQGLQAKAPVKPELLDVFKSRKLETALMLARITDPSDSSSQSKIDTAIAESLNTSDRRFSLQVIDALLPERMRRLEKENPQLTGQLKKDIISMIETPRGFDEEADMVALLGRMGSIFGVNDPGSMKDLNARATAGQLTDKLSIMLNPNSQAAYAKWYPEMRAAAITTLADFGVQDSKSVIRYHLAADKSLSFEGGNKIIASQEPDARVRAAAVDALMRLRDTELAPLVPELIDKESDSTVASKLRDVKFLTDMLEPSSREYSELREQTLELISFSEKYKHLKDFDFNAAKQWLATHEIDGNPAFNLLDYDPFVRLCNQTAKDAMGGWDRFWSHKNSEALAEQTKVFALTDARWKQWETLCKLAKQDGVDGDKARMTLHHIMRHNGQPMGEGGLKLKIQGNKLHATYYNHDYEDFAARALRDAAKVGSGGRDLTAWAISQGLTRGNDLSATTRDNLIEGLKNLRESSKDHGPAISHRQMAQTMAEALKAELEIVGGQTDWFQEALIKELRATRHRMIFPVFDALADKSKFPAVKKEAAQLVADFRDSVSLMWEETPADNGAKPEDRAKRIEQALSGKSTARGAEASAEATVQEIFNAYKDYKITAEDDPGAAHLYMALSHDNERVRLAAAKVIMNSELPIQSFLKTRALERLTKLSTSGSREGYRTDATREINQLKLSGPVEIKTENGERIVLRPHGQSGTGLVEYRGNKPHSIIHPTGTSMTAEWDGEQMSRLRSTNGQIWERQKDSTNNYIDSWVPKVEPSDIKVFEGKREIDSEGNYMFQTKGQEDIYIRQSDGRLVVKKVVAHKQ